MERLKPIIDEAQKGVAQEHDLRGRSKPANVTNNKTHPQSTSDKIGIKKAPLAAAAARGECSFGGKEANLIHFNTDPAFLILSFPFLFVRYRDSAAPL